MQQSHNISHAAYTMYHAPLSHRLEKSLSAFTESLVRPKTDSIAGVLARRNAVYKNAVRDLLYIPVLYSVQ